MLNCPECGAKPHLEEIGVNGWYEVTCPPCFYVGTLEAPWSTRKGIDLAVCDWNVEVLNYLEQRGFHAVVKQHLESLEAVPAWRKYLETIGGTDLLFDQV